MLGGIRLPGRGRDVVVGLPTSRHDFRRLVIRLGVARRGQAQVDVPHLVAFVLLLAFPLDARLNLLELLAQLLGLLLEGAALVLARVAVLGLGGGFPGLDSALCREPGAAFGNPGGDLGR